MEVDHQLQHAYCQQDLAAYPEVASSSKGGPPDAVGMVDVQEGRRYLQDEKVFSTIYCCHHVRILDPLVDPSGA